MFRLLLFSLLFGISAVCYGCPNNETCLAGETCCETKNGLWSCCPIENGICCNDSLHCCAKNEECSSNGNCLSTNNQISFAFPLRLSEIELKTTSCPDGSACADDETCCELASGRYACCTYRDAVCCRDHIHCCPHNHVCDLEHGHCRRNLDQLNDVPCPDGQTACPDHYTCCLLADGGYGCCPIEDAVCCSDHLHCCPHGTVCDVEHRQCVSRLSIPWSIKRAAFYRNKTLTKIIPREEEENLSQLKSSSEIETDIICPDASTLCDSTSTCCLTPESSWGCCPIEQAVCCSDHKHCCPTHYKCDLHIFKCDHEIKGSIPLLETEMAKKKISSKINPSSKSSSRISTIICPDQNPCSDESTCCQLKNDTYGCCPFENGNCCSDQIHCCANGYDCDKSGSRCIRQFNSKKENQMRKLIFNLPHENQTCPDGITRCSINSTCCPNKNTNPLTYSCCPYSKGVCCGSNGSICCPNNYDCNEDQLSCELRDSFRGRELLLTTTEYDQCESSGVYCSSDQTCCNTYGTSDQPFACCSYANGQCCSDGEHCCPLGYTCDVQGGGCL